jgi:hypothetical protein
MHLVWEKEPNEGPVHLETPYIFNLLRDPKEETDVHTASSWARTPMRRMIHEFQQGLKAHPPIPAGAPDDYEPDAARHRARPAPRIKDEGKTMKGRPAAPARRRAVR